MLWTIRLGSGNFLVRCGQIFVGNELVLFAIDAHAICPTIRTQRNAACPVNQYAPCTRLVGTPLTKFSMLSIN